MQTATVSELKKELATRSPKELLEICLTLSKFKKENKELLTYLLYEASNEENYIEEVKQTIDTDFAAIATTRFYLVKKQIRKILKNTKKHIRYSKKKPTEIELLLHFCKTLQSSYPAFHRSRVLQNMFDTQVRMIERKIEKVHEDLQYDYTIELEELL